MEPMNEFNVTVAGIGGQGSVVLAQLIAAAARIDGFEVQTGETLGMAQRGGSVISFVRYGKKIYTPLVPEHETHILISLEPAEALRSIRYVGPNTTIILNTKEKRPLSVLLGEQKYPTLKEIETTLKSAGAKTYAINAAELAEKAGNAKSANACLLGGMATLDSHIKLDSYKAALKEILSERSLQVNMQAFSLGYEAVSALRN
jgi:indolepyruvate ferredoxin oxidoreductase beta subunit